jgi:hypothetical protein
MSKAQSDKPFKWSDKGRIRKQEFAELWDTPAFKDVFNEKYVEGLERRKDSLTARFQYQSNHW